MTELDLEKLKYPTGKFQAPSEYTSAHLSECIKSIESFSDNLKIQTLHLSDEQLDTPYRPNGWTVRQVIHHCTDSHMNCFIRIKWA